MRELKAITIQRNGKRKNHDDVLDVAEYLGENGHESATNALVEGFRDSDLYKKTIKKLPKNKS